MPVGKLIQLITPYPINTLITVHPEPAVIILKNAEHAITEKSVGGVDVHQGAVAVTKQAAVVRADPQSAVVIFIKRTYKGPKDSVVPGHWHKVIAGHSGNARISSHPDVA